MNRERDYQFIILQYVHNVLIEERLNVGILFAVSDGSFVYSRFTDSLNRIKSAFPNTDTRFLRRTFKRVSKIVENESSKRLQYNLFGRPKLEDIAKKILREDDSALQWTKVKSGILYDEPYLVLSELFEIYVSQYDKPKSVKDNFERNTEKVVRDRLAAVGVDLSQEPKKFSNTDSIEFENSWFESTWKAFEALNFDYRRSADILKKARELRGRLDASIPWEERNDFKLWLILREPKDRELRDSYEKARKILMDANSSPSIVEQDEIDLFIKQAT